MRKDGIQSAMKRDQVGPAPKGRPEFFLSRMRRGTVRDWMPVVVATFAFGFLMAPERAWAFSEAGTGLQQNSTNPEQIELILVTPTLGGTGADLSATGGANQFVKQSGVGANFTVGTIADADVPDTITINGTDNVTWPSVNKAGSSLADLATKSAGDLDSGTIPAARVGAAHIDALTEIGDLCAGTQILQRNAGDTAWECIATPSGGSDTTISGKLAMRSSVKFSMGASQTRYMALDGSICTNEADCLIPFEAGVVDNVTCLPTEAQTASNVTIQMGDGTCTATITYGTGFDLAATAKQSATASEAFTFTTGECGIIKISTGAGEALANSYISCSATITGPAA